jgi:cardiolipin synthase
VRVEILLPGPHMDKRFVQLAGESSYARLLECGVRIWRFQPSMLHANIMTVDGVAANIGFANLNARSTKLDEEMNLVAFDPDLVRVLDAQFDEDLERSERIVAGGWKHRSILQHVFGRAAGLFRREV